MHATGVCGTWLARLNPHWNTPADVAPASAAPVDTWETGTPQERVTLLKSVLQSDPDRALAMVRSTWNADGADERRKFIESMAHALSPRVEPFLEAALDDRAKTVRREAARVLALLSGSALRTRMRDRASSMIRVERSKTGILRRAKTSISIEPPQAYDPTWERDAIEEKPSAKKGMRAFWMMQILAATDLSFWTDLSGLAPADVIDALGESDYLADVVGSMIESLAACPSQPDAMAWSVALVAASARSKDPDPSLVARLWLARPSDESESLRLTLLRASEDLALRCVGQAATSDDRPWSPAFSVAMLAILAHHGGKVSQHVDLWHLVEVTSRLVHPSAIDALDRWCASIFPDGPSPSVQKSLSRARGRADMHKEFLA